MTFLVLHYILAARLCLGGVHASARITHDRDGVAFYEQNVRPLLAAKCYSCHSAKARPIQGGLRLDSAEGWTRGGAHGPAVVAGEPDRSRMILAVRHTSG